MDGLAARRSEANRACAILDAVEGARELHFAVTRRTGSGLVEVPGYSHFGKEDRQVYISNSSDKTAIYQSFLSPLRSSVVACVRGGVEAVEEGDTPKPISVASFQPRDIP